MGRDMSLCDACNRDAGPLYATDYNVVGSTDAPGFVLCNRGECIASYFGLPPSTRKRLYERAVSRRDSMREITALGQRCVDRDGEGARWTSDPMEHTRVVAIRAQDGHWSVHLFSGDHEIAEGWGTTLEAAEDRARESIRKLLAAATKAMSMAVQS